MKKTLSILILTLLSFQFSFAEYILSTNEEQKVEKAIVLINNVIDRKWENLRRKLLTKISQILNKPNLSEKNTAIFTKLSLGISLSPVAQEASEKEIAKQINISDFQFIFSDTSNRCNSNPCQTNENFIKIQGRVDNILVKYIEVNDYRLNSYKWSDWEYNPNIAYANFQNGENTYIINYLWKDSEVLFTQSFLIDKVIPENKVEELAKPTIPPTTTDVSELEDEQPSSPVYSMNSDIPYVDENAVREYWLGLINKERTLLWLSWYTYDKSLDKTAKIWSDMALKRWYIDHKVDSPSDSYYDYWKKASWMEDNGVVCKNISRATFSESIAWNNYNCSDTNECTNQLKKAVKRTYDFYMSEKGTGYDPHYKAIAHPLFETMWLWLSVADEGNGKYKMYLTNHYCTTNTK